MSNTRRRLERLESVSGTMTADMLTRLPEDEMARVIKEMSTANLERIVDELKEGKET